MIKKTVIKIVTGLSLFILSGASALFAAGDYDLGQEKAKACISCHGETGMSISPQFPNLAGQYEDYIIQALKDYRNGNRNNAIMKGFAESLSDDDIADLAAYYSQQEGLFTPTEENW